MESLISGQKIKLNNVEEKGVIFTFKLSYSPYLSNSFDIDLFGFILSDGTVNKNDIVFYNNPKSKSMVYTYSYNDNSEDKNIKQIDVYMDKLPDNMDKLVFTGGIYKKDIPPSLKNIDVKFQFHNKLLSYDVFNLCCQCEENIQNYESIILGELYNYKGSWKFNTINVCSEHHFKNLVQNFYSANIY